MTRRKGIFLTDAVVALGLLTALAMVLAAGKSAAVRAGRASDDRRAAVRLAETYLAGDNTPATQSSVAITPLPTPAPAGWHWVSVRAEVNGHAGELVGLTRETR